MKTLKNTLVVKLCCLLILCMLTLAAISANAQTKTPSAAAVLEKAYQQASIEKKNVFVIFHASWCGWCHKMDKAMNDPAVKPFFDKNYVITHLTVLEADDKKSLENPGAAEMLTKYHADKQGIPLWLLFDKNGKLLGDSQIRPAGASLDSPGKNVGCPASKEEVAHFVEVLKKTSSLSTADQAVIETRFRKNEN